MNKRNVGLAESVLVLIWILVAIALYFKISTGGDNIKNYIATHTTKGVITEISSPVNNVQTYRNRYYSISCNVVYYKIKHVNGFEDYMSEQNPLIYGKFKIGDSIDFMTNQGYDKLFHLKRVGYKDVPNSYGSLLFSSLLIFLAITIILIVLYIAYLDVRRNK